MATKARLFYKRQGASWSARVYAAFRAERSPRKRMPVSWALYCKSLGNFRTVAKFQSVFSLPLHLATRGSDVQKLTRKASGKSRTEAYTGWSKVMTDWVIKFYHF